MRILRKIRYIVIMDFTYTLPKKELHATGIYSIKNVTNDRIYVGSSVEMYYRIAYHKSLLKRDKHWNIYFQRSFNKIKDFSKFEVGVLEFCSESDLSFKEQEWINKLHSNVCGYNFNEVTANRGNLITRDLKIKISKKLTQKSGMQSIEMIDKQGNLLKCFDSLVEAAEWIKDNGIASGKLRNIRMRISQSAREVKCKISKMQSNCIRKYSYGFKWRYCNVLRLQ